MFIKPTAEDHVRDVLVQWAQATRLNRRDDVLLRHAPDAVIFDVLAPLKYEGTAAYRAGWDEWQPDTVGEALFDLFELRIAAGEELAFAHGLIHCGGTYRKDGNGGRFEDWVRATFCLRKSDGRWRIVHQHISMPVQRKTADPPFQ
jgi:ketosteroid isomerase-like protein